ncbi:SDR family oxidoreductase [Nakamurella sp. YIM 132087]|uniref:SDR family oxidoreductase n=1 Tax=Nakamurella alba TaxID=2665158 RepID=A0A7K1FIT3_9ACTN|nr:SDR family oxidoreductase [Nakamurella alba]MTD14035.1 SDR family oxidoreductase [Nakamurella alba]
MTDSGADGAPAGGWVAGRRLAGKRIAISGSSRGLGRSFAMALAAEGAAVVVNGTDQVAVDGVVAEIRAAGGTAVAVTGSVADDAVAERIVAACVGEFGGIDVAITNAAVARDRTLLKATVEEFDESIAVNLRGTWSVCRHAARAMVDRGGHLLLVPSAAALTGSYGQSSYVASKGGVFALMYTLNEELARYGIRVNAFGPTAATGMTAGRIAVIEARARSEGRRAPEPRDLGFGSPDEVAPAVVYLCSDRARALTGQFVRFNGRRLALWRHAGESVVIDRERWDADLIADNFPARQEPVWRLTPGAAVSVADALGPVAGESHPA